jgi:protoheme IX farnesyltransferase
LSAVTAQTVSASRTWPEVLRDYLSLFKLRIVSLLLVTAVAPMLPAAHGRLELRAVLGVLIGGTLAAAGAHAINCWFDRDIDASMSRTRRRPIPEGRIPAWHALTLGIALNVAAFAALALLANVLAASLAILGTLIYVFVYTIWLKRSTPQNIVIGGAAGAVPPLVGWAAATGGLDLTALSLFLVVFFWTPPHFWALAQVISSDYRSAGIPMLPVVAGRRSAQRQGLVYALLLLAVSLIPFFTSAAGSVYLAGALVLGLGFIAVALLDLFKEGWTVRVFAASIVYLAALFALFAVTPFV